MQGTLPAVGSPFRIPSIPLCLASPTCVLTLSLAKINKQKNVKNEKFIYLFWVGRKRELGGERKKSQAGSTL